MCLQCITRPYIQQSSWPYINAVGLVLIEYSASLRTRSTISSSRLPSSFAEGAALRRREQSLRRARPQEHLPLHPAALRRRAAHRRMRHRHSRTISSRLVCEHLSSPFTCAFVPFVSVGSGRVGCSSHTSALMFWIILYKYFLFVSIIRETSRSH